jgi:hypothetical protein
MLILTSSQTGAAGPKTTTGFAVVCAPADGNTLLFILTTYTINTTKNLHNNTTPTRRLRGVIAADHHDCSLGTDETERFAP